jgi:hypothetical protein
MKIKILLIVLTLVVASLYFVPVNATGLESYLTRNAVSRVGAESSLEWVQRTGVNGYLYVDRQGLPPTPTSWAIGNIATGSTKSSGLDYFTIVNNANSDIDVSIIGTDMTNGIPWTLDDTATPGLDTYGMKAGLDGTAYNIIVKKTAPYNLLVNGMPSGGSQKWGVQLYAPTDFSDGVAKTTTITMSVSLH